MLQDFVLSLSTYHFKPGSNSEGKQSIIYTTAKWLGTKSTVSCEVLSFEGFPVSEVNREHWRIVNVNNLYLSRNRVIVCILVIWNLVHGR